MTKLTLGVKSWACYLYILVRPEYCLTSVQAASCLKHSKNKLYACTFTILRPVVDRALSVLNQDLWLIIIIE